MGFVFTDGSFVWRVVIDGVYCSGAVGDEYEFAGAGVDQQRGGNFCGVRDGMGFLFVVVVAGILDLGAMDEYYEQLLACGVA